MTGWGGVAKQRVSAQRIVLIRAQELRDKTISCIGQVLHALPNLVLHGRVVISSLRLHR